MGEQIFNYFFRAKWPYGYSCPRCSHTFFYRIDTRCHPLFQCQKCRHQTSLTAGTIMENSRTPLDKWYMALQLIMRPEGVNAVQLTDAIAVTYKTAWLMLMKIRKAISEADKQELLSGDVFAMLGSYGGGWRRNTLPRIHRAQPCAIIAPLSETKQTTEVSSPEVIKLKLVPRALLHEKRMPKVLQPLFSKKHIDTNPRTAFNMIDVMRNFEHQKLPNFGSFRLQLYYLTHYAKRTLNCTFRGIGPKYLQQYLDEFSFRYNQSPSLTLAYLVAREDHPFIQAKILNLPLSRLYFFISARNRILSHWSPMDTRTLTSAPQMQEEVVKLSRLCMQNKPVFKLTKGDSVILRRTA